MSNLIDGLQQGLVSRRRLMELLAGAAGVVTIASSPLRAQDKRTKAPAGIVEPPKFSPANIGGGGRIERDFYRNWLKTSKVPMLEGYSLLDATKQEVQPWPEIGGKGLYLNFSGNVHMDGVIQEIPSGKALEPQRHFYEQIVYVLSGRGYTNVGGGNKPNKVSWAEGSLFTVPVNELHRHYNSDPAHPARLLLITTFPFMIQVFGSMGLINDSNFSFSDRFDGAPDYYSSTARVRKRWDKTNFVKDVRAAEVVLWEERGDGNASMFYDMGGNTVLEPHISEFEVGSYKLGHRHPYEAIILTLNGRGYSLAEKDRLKESEAVKIDWQAGSIVSPPFFWFHQHFNTGTTKARYLAITEGDFPLRLGIPLKVEQIEGPQEDPEIKIHFDRETHRA
jgi:quercetin dioxygenase-like cupin family protein